MKRGSVFRVVLSNVVVLSSNVVYALSLNFLPITCSPFPTFIFIVSPYIDEHIYFSMNLYTITCHPSPVFL